MTKHSVDRFLRACGGSEPIQLHVEHPDGTSGVFSFHQPFVLIGYHERADLRLVHEQISQRQLYLQLMGGRLFGVSLSQRVPTHWNGEPRTSGWIDPTHVLTFGPFTLRFLGGASPLGDDNALANPLTTAQIAPPVSLELERQDGKSKPLRGVLDRDLVIIGHHRICRIQVTDPNLSSIHCSLVRARQELWAVDLCGKGGIRGNGVTVRCVHLEHGDVLELGGRSFRIQIDNPQRENPSVAPESAASEPMTTAIVAALDEPRGDAILAPTNQSLSDVAVSEDLLVLLVERFTEFQNQSHAQFQEIVMGMMRIFGAMLSDQREFVRLEMERLERLCEPKTAAGLPELRAAAPQPEDSRASANGSTSEGAATNEPSGASSAPAPGSTAEVPPRIGDRDFHHWLQERIEALGSQRSSLWQRLTSLLGRKSQEPREE